MSFNCFSIRARFLQGVQLNCPQGVRRQGVQRIVSESLGEIVSFLISTEAQSGTRDVQGVHRVSEISGLQT
jgi:hypothetical protein